MYSFIHHPICWELSSWLRSGGDSRVKQPLFLLQRADLGVEEKERAGPEHRPEV